MVSVQGVRNQAGAQPRGSQCRMVTLGLWFRCHWEGEGGLGENPFNFLNDLSGGSALISLQAVRRSNGSGFLLGFVWLLELLTSNPSIVAPIFLFEMNRDSHTCTFSSTAARSRIGPLLIRHTYHCNHVNNNVLHFAISGSQKCYPGSLSDSQGSNSGAHSGSQSTVSGIVQDFK